MDKIRILVVDDESRMRKLVRDFLVKSNFDVLQAGDGEEALELMEKKGAYYKLYMAQFAELGLEYGIISGAEK